MKSKLGIQTQWDSGEALRYNREVQPVAVMGINVAKADWWSQLALDNPGVKRIYRHHPNSDEIPSLTRWYVNPERAALDFVAFLRGYLGDTLDELELVAGDNEFILSKDYESLERIALADRFMATFVRETDLLLGKGVCVGNFNVGHWGPETVSYFPHTLTAIQTQAIRGERLSYFCFHEYNWPLLRDDTHWYTGKFLRAMPPILEQYPDVPCMITEVGIDRASRVSGGHAGFRKTHDDINVAIEGYCGDHGLAWYNDLLNQTDYVAAALIFGCGMGDWRSMGFDVMNDVDDVEVLDYIETYPKVAPPEPEVKVDIYDFNHGPGDAATRDWDWLRSVFGDVRVHPIENKVTVNLGDIVYKVVWLNAKRGNTSLCVNVLDVEGKPVERETVMWGWPDAPPHGYAGKPSNWSERAVPQDTNANGDAGPGMGTGSYYDPATERGAHEIWVWDLPSDFVDGLGMIAGTFHDHVEIGYRAIVWGEEPSTPPIPPDDDTLKLIQVDVAKIRAILEEGHVPPEPEVFHAEYFPNVNLEGEPTLTRDEEAIDHFWGAGSPGLPVPADYFSARWTGEFTFEEGRYEFSVLVDDGFRLWVGEALKIETWKPQSPTEYKATITFLSTGKCSIKAEYYEQAGGATCRLAWRKL